LRSARAFRRTVLRIGSHFNSNNEFDRTSATNTFSVQVVLRSFSAAIIPRLSPTFIFAIFRTISCWLEISLAITTNLRIHNFILPNQRLISDCK
jgi:hypothetical protein